MTEKEKCRLGLLYNAGADKELSEERIKCKTLCREYNLLPVSELDKRSELIKQIVGKCGADFFIEQSFWCDYGYNISFGDNFYVNHNCVILDCAKVTFGDNVFIAPNCGFYTAGHPLDISQRNAGLEYAKPIAVGDNVWIGGNTVVLPGVTIGDNVTVAAGSVVTKDIPSNTMAAGNPCRVKKQL